MFRHPAIGQFTGLLSTLYCDPGSGHELGHDIFIPEVRLSPVDGAFIFGPQGNASVGLRRSLVRIENRTLPGPLTRVEQ